MPLRGNVIVMGPKDGQVSTRTKRRESWEGEEGHADARDTNSTHNTKIAVCLSILS